MKKGWKEKMIDLRSDVKTLPSPAMRCAMCEAEVGDDVAREDPAINALEAHCAEVLGKQDAVFVPSGTQGNLVCIYTLLRPGEELICHEQAHIYHYERGGMSAICGVLVRPLSGRYGAFDLQLLADTLHDGDLHRQRTGLVCLENTHNNCGGTVLTAEYTSQVCSLAHQHGVPVHLDGARIFNAAVALDIEAATLVEEVDTVTICLSKGLGAPVGSVVCGSEEVMERVRGARKLFGGGMRQAGVLAAAGLWALEHNLPRLADDHRNARLIAETLVQLPGIEVDLDSVQTNMVYLSVRRDDMTAPQLCARLADYGINATSRDEHSIRLVTHLNVSDEDTRATCAALREILG